MKILPNCVYVTKYIHPTVSLIRIIETQNTSTDVYCCNNQTTHNKTYRLTTCAQGRNITHIPTEITKRRYHP